MNKILLLLSVFIFSDLYAQTVIIPNKEFLIKRTFSDSWEIGGWSIKFYSNNTYKITYGSEGKYWHDEGEYDIKDGKAYLTPRKCYDCENGPVIDCKKSMGNGVCYLEEYDKSLDYTKYLICKSNNNKHLLAENQNNDRISFPVLDSKIKEGSKKIINNISVIMLGSKKGITTSDVKIRKKPSIDSEIVYYKKGLFGDEAKELPYVPANVDVILMARTENKEKVQKWENYWYYVDVGIIQNVWMFGEFVKYK